MTAPAGISVVVPVRNKDMAALERFVGNQSRVARALGISRNTLFARMRKYRIPRPRASSY